jgi:hypothetical protein
MNTQYFVLMCRTKLISNGRGNLFSAIMLTAGNYDGIYLFIHKFISITYIFYVEVFDNP